MGAPPTREASLRALISRLSEDADEPQIVAVALVGIRKELRNGLDGPADVVKVRIICDSNLTAAAAEMRLCHRVM